MGKKKSKNGKDKIKEEGTRGGEPRGEGKEGTRREKKGGAPERKREKGEKKRREEEEWRRGGEKLDTDRSIKLDPMDIKFRYLVLLNTRNLPMVFDKNFNS